jgi:hypothetical protein
MNTNHFTALGTNPFLFFIMDKMSDPKFIYHIEIVDHTHAIPGSVPLIQLLQPGAGIAITAFRTILGFTASDMITVSYFTRRATF